MGSVSRRGSGIDWKMAAENRILSDQIKWRVQLSDAERRTLAEIGKKLSKHALEKVATIVKPDPILARHWKFVAQNLGVLEPNAMLCCGRGAAFRRLGSWLATANSSRRSDILTLQEPGPPPSRDHGGEDGEGQALTSCRHRL